MGVPIVITPTAIADLEAGAQSLDVFHNRAIQVGDPDLEAVSHRQLVGIHQELIRQ